MFSAVLWELTGSRDADVIGDHLHGWLMAEASVAPALATRLHAPERGKPFSIWCGKPDLPSRNRPDGRLLRVTSLDSELTRFLSELQPRSVRYGHLIFNCSRKWTPGTHAWTAQTSDEELWHRCMESAPPPSRVSLTFLSATTFARGRGTTTLFPTAPLVFRSLIKSWDENARAEIDPNLASELLECVQEESHSIRSVPPLSFQSHRLKGFVGECEYSCGRHGSERAKRLLHLLARLAFYSGVGLKRTMGMGQVICHRVAS